MAGETNEVLWRGIQLVSGINGILPARNAQRAYASAWQPGNSTVVVYTVPAGKKLFISSLFLGGRQTAAAPEAIYVMDRDAGDVNQRFLIYHIYSGIGSQSSYNLYVPAIELPAGYDLINISTHANIAGRTIMHGWLEDV